ncbi:TonB family protein [Spirosoma montaniterrae]|uniref:TonB C-terminal domain-containing protein n=1 Tax=Spirosoma montaniterrae TaxID=1178516 RepID=A0A1P9WZG5_9BACT|nr:TonB family protein [Spirosoma montaniterrae]AQG80745.1 hypothetical protein AWR27_16305 [Spirosoma montaniterrae]
MTALDYFLKANLYGLLFIGCYYALLRRHTFFGLNRAYLLASVVFSLALPLVTISEQVAQKLPMPMATVGVFTLPTVAVNAPQTVAVVSPTDAAATAFDSWEGVGKGLYGLVVSLLLLRLTLRLWQLRRLIQQSPKQAGPGYTLVLPNDTTIPTFSFFRYIVLNPADVGSGLVLQHERVHVRQIHSADVLGLAVLRAVFWACPVLWFVEQALRQVHEFLADRTATAPTDYARFLVEYSFGLRPDRLTNSFFNPSLLKQRLLMLGQRTTPRWALSKYALVLPGLLLLLAMTARRSQSFTNQTQPGTITVTGRVTGLPTEQSLARATVLIKGTNRGTNTDSEGRYQLTDVQRNASLVFSHIGFITNEVKLSGQTAVNVSLTPTVNKLNEVLITGYSTKSIDTTTATLPSTTLAGKSNEVFTVAEQQPQFPGGAAALQAYLARTLRYPIKAIRERITGIVVVRFTVMSDGRIDDIYVEQGIGGGCNEEAIRVVGQMPNWNPGIQDGKAVSVSYALPLQFYLDLDDKEDKRTGRNEPAKSLTVDNSKNAPYLLVNDVKQSAFPTIDSSYKQIRIRGKGPLGELGEPPLYIVDGVEISTDKNAQLDPNQIQSIEVLKSSSATSQYGEKGRNGVIIITTKKP